MTFSRRQFIELGFVATLLPYVAACSENSAPILENIIIGGGRYKDLNTGETKHVLSINDLNKNLNHQVPMNFLAHGIHIHPSQSERLAIFEKKGPHACEFDLKKKMQLLTLKLMPRK